MSFLMKLFGIRDIKEAKAPTVDPALSACAITRQPSRDERFAEFASRACDSRQTITIKIKEGWPLVGALEQMLNNKKTLDRSKAFAAARDGLTFACPKCGVYTKDARDVALMAGEGGAFQQMAGVTFGGPIVASLGEGKCPGCKDESVNATFDPRRAGVCGPSDEQILRDAKNCFTEATVKLVMRQRAGHKFTDKESFCFQWDTACQMLAQKHGISCNEASGYLQRTIIGKELV